MALTPASTTLEIGNHTNACAGAMALDGATIFVVDDDEAVRASLRLLLESYGLHVEAHASTEAFVDAYRPHGQGCLILDQHLQAGKTGLDFLDSGAPTRLHLPVILVTGRGDDVLRARAFQAGAAAYLEKPLDEAQLIAAIGAAIGGTR
jgi:FixJ family two-component response regulator